MQPSSSSCGETDGCSVPGPLDAPQAPPVLRLGRALFWVAAAAVVLAASRQRSSGAHPSWR